jgi:hypothetical protein
MCEGRHRAFSILGHVNDHAGFRPVFGVVVIPEMHCPRLLRNSDLDRKTLGHMGFERIDRVDRSSLANGHNPSEPMLYYFERAPQPGEVVVAKLALSGGPAGNGRPRLEIATLEIMRGEPHLIIPQISGPLAARHIYTGLPSGSFPEPARASMHPAPPKGKRCIL